ncbi:MAG: T9SS type A sorting domain-containing protein [Paludibacteraceae bacterium]
MKKLLIVLLLISFGTDIYSQTETSVFAPMGAKWYYGIQSSHFAPDIYYSTVEYIKDTVINNKPCAVLEVAKFYNPDEKIITGYQYLNEELQKVYLWDKADQRFMLLYDFSLKAGESWDIESNNCSATIHVDSVKSITYSGVPLRTLYISTNTLPFSCIEIRNFFQPYITERISMAQFIFWYRYIPGLDMDIPTFRCYFDGEISIQTPGVPCDYITSSTNDVTANDELSISMKNNRIYFANADLAGTDVKICDISGQWITTGTVNSDNSIEANRIPKGVYLLNFLYAKELKTIKFIMP